MKNKITVDYITKKEKLLPKPIAIAVKIIATIIIAIMLIMILLIYIFGSNSFVNKMQRAESIVLTSFTNATPKEVTLTSKDKEKDFIYLYNALKKGCPGASVKINGKSFVDRKKEYLELLINTNNNFEYYCTLTAIMSNIPSCHTGIITDPELLKSQVGALNAYNVLTTQNLGSYTAYWDNIYKDKIKELDVSNHIEFLYVGGEYICSPNYSFLSDDYENSKLISVNDMPVDEYTTLKLYPSIIRYDSYNEKWYRNRVDFNNVSGEDAELKIKMADGTEKILNCYFDITSSSEFLISYANHQIQTNDIRDKCYTLETKDNFSYLVLNNFSDDSIFEIEDKLSDLRQNIPLIIDVRENGGGLIKNVTDYFYPMLYDTPAEYSNKTYIKNSGEIAKPFYYLTWVTINKNRFVFSNKINAPADGFYYEMQTDIEAEGNANTDRYIYFIIGKNSFSATDMLVNMVKGKDNTLIIGSNTGGEGLTSNFYMDMLPNSKLVYLFTPSFSLNSDGKDDAIYGTSPDIYAELSVDGYIKKQKLIADGQDPYTYENRLKWDDVLIKTLEIINEKETTE